MKRFFAGLLPAAGLALGFCVSGAGAADWDGGYLGVHAGLDRGDAAMSFDYGGDRNQTYTSSTNPVGLSFGLFGGVNRQTDAMVLGVEGDFTLSDLSKGASTYDDPSGNPEGGIRGYMGVNWTASARLKAGYAMDSLLPYVAGGLAMADVEFGYDFFPDKTQGNDGGDTMLGWTLGVGADYALGPNMFGRAEYRFSDYGTAKSPLDARGAGGDPTSPGRTDLSTHSLMLGVGMRF